MTPCRGRLAVRQIRLSTGRTGSQQGTLPTPPGSHPRPLLARLWGAENAVLHLLHLGGNLPLPRHNEQH